MEIKNCVFFVVLPGRTDENLYVYCSSYKKTARRLLVLAIVSNLPENTRLTFLKKLNFSRHAYKSTSSLTDGHPI